MIVSSPLYKDPIFNGPADPMLIPSAAGTPPLFCHIPNILLILGVTTFYAFRHKSDCHPRQITATAPVFSGRVTSKPFSAFSVLPPR